MFVFISIWSFGIAEGQRLPPAGDQLGQPYILAEHVDQTLAKSTLSTPGYIRPISCGSANTQYNSCYEWRAEQKAQFCLRARRNSLWRRELFHAFVHPVNIEYRVLSTKGFDQKIYHGLITAKDLEAAKQDRQNLPITHFTKIDCAQTETLKQAAFSQIVPMAEFLGKKWLSHNIHNCIFAEESIKSPPYQHDDWHYFCAAYDNVESALYDIDTYGSALIRGGAEDWNKSKKIALSLALKHSKSDDGHCFSRIKMDVQSAAEVTEYYDRNRLETNMDGNAAALLAIERIPCSNLP